MNSQNELEVLISAMRQNDFSLFYNAGISTDALMINQCDRDETEEKNINGNHIRIISTTERGLSKSRNLALMNTEGKYALICDDDEVLYKDYEEKILKAYAEYPDADLICFKVLREDKTYPDKASKIGYLKALKISSVQITMRVDKIKEAGIWFDERYGAGTPNGSGEETIFLYDCLNKGLKVYYVPVLIGEVKQTESTWFQGFDEAYFRKRGRIIRRLMGKKGIFYCVYFAMSKYSRFKENMSMWKAFSLMVSGLKENESVSYGEIHDRSIANIKRGE